MTYLVCLPSIWPAYTKQCLAGLDPKIAEHTLVLDNTIENLGVAGSWNVGARRVIAEKLDWLVVLSAATRFGVSGGRDFIEHIEENPDAWIVESGWALREPSELWVGWHLLAWSRTNILERVGLFDENYWPAYGEDADISWRVLLAMRDAGGKDVWRKCDVDAWIEMQGHGVELAKVPHSMARTIRYHTEKWGGWSGAERFTHPFGDPDLPLSFWPVPPDPRSIIGVPL